MKKMYVYGLSFVFAIFLALASCKEVVVNSSALRDDSSSSDSYVAYNIGGATDNNVVAFEDETEVLLNGVILTTLNKGEIYNFAAAQFDEIEADKPFYVAGRAGSGAGAAQANVAWHLEDWAGTEFGFDAIRLSFIEVTVYALEDANVDLYSAGSGIASTSITAGQSHTFTITTFASYELFSSGNIFAHYAAKTGSGNGHADVRPLMPASTDAIGFPSTSAYVNSVNDNTNISFVHSNGTTGSQIVNTGSRYTISGLNNTGTTLFRCHALRVLSDNPVGVQQFADSNGSAASSFVPTSYVKYHRLYLNNSGDYAAFVSLQPGTINVYDGTGTFVTSLSFSGSGATDAPYLAYYASPGSGYRFESDVPMAGWYQPDNNTGSSDLDETYLYGAED